MLNKRENYRRALNGFDPTAIASYGQSKLDELVADDGIGPAPRRSRGGALTLSSRSVRRRP
nr:DNA-3-methyladenine glycosylase I [Streptomyces rhizosphaericus]